MASEKAQKLVSLQPEPCSPTVDHENAVYIGMRVVDGQQAVTAEVCALAEASLQFTLIPGGKPKANYY